MSTVFKLLLERVKVESDHNGAKDDVKVGVKLERKDENGEYCCDDERGGNDKKTCYVARMLHDYGHEESVEDLSEDDEPGVNAEAAEEESVPRTDECGRRRSCLTGLHWRWR